MGDKFHDLEYVFANEDGTPQSSHEIYVRWNRFMKSQDKVRYLSFHSGMRHTFASLCVSNKVDIKTLQSLMGHADVSTTLNTYSTVYEENKIDCVNRLEQLIFEKEA